MGLLFLIPYILDLDIDKCIGPINPYLFKFYYDIQMFF